MARLEQQIEAVHRDLGNGRILGLQPNFQTVGGPGNTYDKLYVYRRALYAVLKALSIQGFLFLDAARAVYLEAGRTTVAQLRELASKRASLSFLRDVSDFAPTPERILDHLRTAPVLQVPTRQRQERVLGTQIRETTMFVVDCPAVSDDEIVHHLVAGLRLAENALDVRSQDFSAEQYQNLRATLPPEARTVADFFATKMGIADEIGVSRRAQKQAERRVVSVMDWSEKACARAELRVGARAPKHEKAAIHYQLRRQAVQHQVWTNLKIAAARGAQRKSSSVEWLLPTLRAAVQDLGAFSKDAHDSPVDALILESGMNSFNWRSDDLEAGGQVAALTRIVNAIAERKGVEKISRSAVYNACGEAGIIFGAVKNTSRAPNPDQHYAAWFIAFMQFLACLLSRDSVFVAIDAKQLLKANTSDATDRGVAGRGGNTAQLRDAPVTAVDHSANTTSTLAKFSLFSMYALSLDAARAAGRLETIDIEEFGKFLAGLLGMEPCEVPDTETDPLRRLQKLIGIEPYERASYANILGFVESVTPETGYRNLMSLYELVDRHPEQFLAADGSGVAKNWFIETDGGHGPGELMTQFAAGVLFVLLKLDFLVLFVNAGGCSVFNPAERLNGAASRRTNRTPLTCPHPSPESLDRSALEVVLDEMNEALCHRVNGATFSEASSKTVCCEPASLSALGWEIRLHEVHAFIKSDDKENFSAPPMPGYARPADLYRSVPILCANQTSTVSCTDALSTGVDDSLMDLHIGLGDARGRSQWQRHGLLVHEVRLHVAERRLRVRPDASTQCYPKALWWTLPARGAALRRRRGADGPQLRQHLRSSQNGQPR